MENKSRIRAYQRIGPHSQLIYSIIIVSLLGDGHLEKRCNAIRLKFHVSAKNKFYLYFLHQILSRSEYCSETIPKIREQKKDQ